MRVSDTIRRLCRLRFSVRTLLLVIGFCGLACGLWSSHAERQHRAIEAIRAAGGHVLYDFQEAGLEVPSPEWLSAILPDDYLAAPDAVWLPPNATDSDLRPVGELRNLRRLLLGGTTIGDEGLSYLTNLHNLQELYLDGTRKRGAGLAPTSPLSSSGTGADGGMELNRIALSHVGTLTNLRVLSLRGTMLSEEGLQELGALSNLRELDLAHSAMRVGGTWEWLDDTEITQIVNLAQLESLDVSGTNVSDASVPLLARLTKLKKLFLSDTDVSKAGHEELRRALPSCQVFR